MVATLTNDGSTWPRALSFLAGIGMMAASVLTMRHFFAANYPESIFEGSFCDINAFFNCDSSAFSSIAAIGGAPMGTFGLVVGALVALGALFPSAAFERTNKTISLANAVGVVVLLGYSVLILKSLCLLCTLYYVCALASFGLFWRYGIDRGTGVRGFMRPSFLHAGTFAVAMGLSAYALAQYDAARQDAQAGGVAARIVQQYYNLPPVAPPDPISPFFTAGTAEQFEDAPIRVVEYADFLCSDCRYLNNQLNRLKREFEGHLAIAFQFFPLEAACNQVVEKDKHPGACELSYIAAHDPEAFLPIHDAIFADMEAARDPAWRAALAARFHVEDALTDTTTHALVHRLINTGATYEQTSDAYAHGIRSTPTMIVNNRMIIGTLPYEQLRAIFQALVDEHEAASKAFIENWEPTK